MWRLPAALLAVLLALISFGSVATAAPSFCNPGHPVCPTPDPPPPRDPEMALTAVFGWETQALLTEAGSSAGFSGTASFSTAQARTGTASLRCNPASGAAGELLGLPGAVGNKWWHFGLYIATMPSVRRIIAGGGAGVGKNTLQLNSDGTLSVYVNTTAAATTTQILSTNTWYWIGFRNRSDGAAAVLIQIDGIDAASGTSGTVSGTGIGASSTEASAIDIYIDDFITDDAGFIGPSKVGLAIPISDNSRIDWTNDASGTTNLFDAVNNKPPVGIADTTSGTGLNQIRDATNGTDTYVANLTTYTNVGVGALDTLLAVQVLAATAAPSATSPKAGSFTVSNPTIANASFGNFYNGSAIAGTFPAGWAQRQGAITTSPTVTLGNSPVVTVQQDTSSTRIAMVSFLGLYVAWTPFVAPSQPYFQPMPPLLAQ